MCQPLFPIPCAHAVPSCPLWLQNKSEEPLWYSWESNGKSSQPGSFFFLISVKFSTLGKLCKLSSGNWKGKTITYHFSAACKCEINQEIKHQDICDTRFVLWMFKAFNLCSSGSQSWLLGHYYFTYFPRYNHLHLKNFLAVFCIPLCTTWINLHNFTHLSHFLPSGLSSEHPHVTQWSPHCQQQSQLFYFIISPLGCLPELGPVSLSHSPCSDRDRHELSFPSPPKLLSLHPLGHRTSPSPSLHTEWWQGHGSGQCGSPGDPHKPRVKLRLPHLPLALMDCTEEPVQNERGLSKQPSKDLLIDGRPENRPCSISFFCATWLSVCLQTLVIPGVMQGPLPQQVSIVPLVRAWLQLFNSHWTVKFLFILFQNKDLKSYNNIS